MTGRGLQTVQVVGAGAMGSQIAMSCALAGYAVSLSDQDPSVVAGAVERLRARLDGQVAKGRRTRDEVDAAFDRLATPAQPVTDVDLVIEAVVEKLEVKRELFQALDAACAPHTILASNSSSFVPSAMAGATARPDRFVNLHFFNPALVMKCVEVVRGPQTSEETMATATAFAESLGKVPVVLDREIPGFVANRLLNAVRDEAISLLEGRFADVEAIDTAARTALGYPMGPFELMDLTGIDIGYYTKLGRFEETGDPADRPSETVTELVRRGDLGRKTGRGFYTYDADGHREGKAI